MAEPFSRNRASVRHTSNVEGYTDLYIGIISIYRGNHKHQALLSKQSQGILQGFGLPRAVQSVLMGKMAIEAVKEVKSPLQPPSLNPRRESPDRRRSSTVAASSDV